MPGITLIDEHGNLYEGMNPQAGGHYARMVEVPADKLNALKELTPEQRHPTQLRARTPQELTSYRQQRLVDAKAGQIEWANKITGKMIVKSLGSLEVVDDTSVLNAIKTEITAANAIRQSVRNATTVEGVHQVIDNRKP